MSDASELIAQQILNASINKKNLNNVLYMVKVYGAQGDGVYDDTQAVQDTIDVAVLNNATLVYFHPGSYKVTSLTDTETIHFVGDNAEFVGYDGDIQQFGSAGSGVGGINVRDYGAMGDGIADDTEAFQEAIDYAITVGGVVSVPFGNYRVGELYISNRSGVDIIGVRSAHDADELGSILIYTGTQRCINIVQDDGDFIYRVTLKDFTIYFEQNCLAGIYLKNLQESTIENVGIWGRSKTVQVGIDADSASIVNIDNCIISRCVVGIKGHYNDPPNPQASYGSNISRCNIFLCTNSIEIGYTIGMNIFENWIEGFQNGVLVDNTTGWREVTGLNVKNNFFIQSTNGLTDTRALNVNSGNNSNPMRIQYNFSGNTCYMNSSGATSPNYIVSNTVFSNIVEAVVDCVIKSNYFYGATVSAVYSDSPTVNAYVSENDTRSTLFGSRSETISGLNMITPVYCIANTAIEITAANTIVETLIKAADVPARIMGDNGSLRVRAVFSVTNNANNKTIRLKLGSTTVGQFNMASTSDAVLEFLVSNVNASNLQVSKGSLLANSRTEVAVGSATENTTVITPILFTVEKAVAGDVVNLSTFTVEVLPR